MEYKQRFLNQDSPPDIKKRSSDTVYANLSDYFFDQINFISYPFSQVEVGGYTSTTDYGGKSRLTDTAEGKFLNPSREARMRCNFYLTQPTKVDGYLLCPAIYDSFSSLNTITSVTDLRAYFGLRFKNSEVYVVVKEAGGSERVYSTGLAASGDTWPLEIKYRINYSEISINNNFVGSYSTNLIGNFTTQKTFLPLFSPAKSTDGTSINITVENYQFIQDK